jgi:[NiFe] hydrogenase diaphorase moiety small subunit
MNIDMEKIKFQIDNKDCEALYGEMLVDAARKNGVYIPTLCNMHDTQPCGSCRVCTVKINGRFATACTTPVACGMEIESETQEIKDIRTGLIELLFAEGNHYCPTCEMSGNCDLQALGYKFQMLVPRFPYNFPQREVNTDCPHLIIDYNRCIRCKRCIRTIKDSDGKSYFAFQNRGDQIEVSIDSEMAKTMSVELAELAKENCPVGAILTKEVGFRVPIGERKYDKKPIGTDVVNAEVLAKMEEQ